MSQVIAEAERVIRENCHLKVNEVVAMLDISYGSAYHFIHDILQFHKVVA
jgi:hypothetical protein